MTDSQPASSANSFSESTASHPVRQRSSPYPRYSLQKVEELARVVFDKGPLNCDQELIGKATGYTNFKSGSFTGLRAAASYFGLVISEGDRYFSVAQSWIDVFHSEDSDLLTQARQRAMQEPELYRQILEEYKDRQLPSPEKLARELYLNPKYRILKDAAVSAVQTFIDSAKYASLIDSKGFLRVGKSNQSAIVADVEQQTAFEPEQQPQSLVEQFTQQARSESPLAEITLSSKVEELAASGGLDRIEIRLRNGRKAYLFVPSPLTMEDKKRLKGYIDLILEPEEPLLRNEAHSSDINS